MKYLLTILLLGIWSTDASATTNIDPLYIDMIREFEEDMVWKVSSSVIVTGLKRPKILGFCRLADKSIWLRPATTSLPYIVRKALIYHELAHCELGLQHSKLGDGTLTDPLIYISNPFYYEVYWSTLVWDLRMKYSASLP